jgi:hypothetical protein
MEFAYMVRFCAHERRARFSLARVIEPGRAGHA